MLESLSKLSAFEPQRGEGTFAPVKLVYFQSEIARPAGTSRTRAVAQRTDNKISRADRIAVALLLIGGVLLAASRFNDLLGLTGDNAVYLLLARNLATGQPYDNAGFPWGYPALLTPGVALFGPEHLIDAVPWLKLITVAAFLLSLLLLYFLFRLRLSPLLAGGAVALFAANDITLVYTNDLMTELPYIAAVAAALLFWQRRIVPPAEEGWSTADEAAMGTTWRHLLLAGVLLVIPYYLRSIGLALFPAAPLALLLRRRVREAFLLGGIMVALAAPWAVFSSVSDPDRNYTASLLLRDPYHPDMGRISSIGEFLARLVDTGVLYAAQVWPTMMMPGVGAPWRDPVGLLLLLGVLAGFVLRLVRRIEITEIFVAVSMFILLAWPWRGDRFLLPLIPFLLFYLMESLAGLGRLARYLLARSRPTVEQEQQGRTMQGSSLAARLLLVLLLIALAMPNLVVAARTSALNIRYVAGDVSANGWGDDWNMFFAASRWVGQHSPMGSIVLSRKSSLTEIYAGRTTELIPLIPPADFPEWLAEHNVTYIIEDDFPGSVHTIDHLRPALQLRPDMYKLLYSTEEPVTRVWQVIR